MYGWTTPGHMIRHLSSNGDTQEDFRDVVKEFQTFFRLNITGELDEETINLMKKPRCANVDVVRSHRFLSSFFNIFTNNCKKTEIKNGFSRLGYLVYVFAPKDTRKGFLRLPKPSTLIPCSLSYR